MSCVIILPHATQCVNQIIPSISTGTHFFPFFFPNNFNTLRLKFIKFIKLRQRKPQPRKRFGTRSQLAWILMILVLPLLLSFCFDWVDISNTRNSVSSAIQTPWISSKILCCAAYFQLSSWCLDILMKHCLSWLIYYLTTYMYLLKCGTSDICWLKSRKVCLKKFFRSSSDCWHLLNK